MGGWPGHFNLWRYKRESRTGSAEGGVWRIAGLLLRSSGGSLQGERDQTIDECVDGDSTCLPEFRVHADGSEAGNGIDLVHTQLAVRACQKEIDASNGG